MAKTSNKANKQPNKVIFRNYHRYVDQQTLDDLAVNSDEGEKNAGEKHLQEVVMIEKMYEKKVGRAIKQQLKTEDEPIACLRPKKANIDLKRGLEVKLAQLSAKTDRSILEILSKLNS